MTGLPKIPDILVVDDDPIVREVVVRILGGSGLRVHQAETADEAMAVLTTLAGERPQLVIIDIVLPGRNGVELARQIREELPDQPLLYMSAYPREYLREEGLGEGTEAFLAKPFTPERLLQRVQEVLAGAGARGLPAPP